MTALGVSGVVGAWIMLVAGGLFGGGVLLVALERVNQWQRMPVEQYAVDFRRSLYRLDPLLPILGSLAAAGAAAYAFAVDGRPAVLAAIGIGTVAVIIVGSVLIAEPINSKFRRLPEGSVPADVNRIRLRWRRFHYIRTAAALLALGSFAAAAIGGG
ncbi:hypothetical protein QQ25_14015 [Mycolicibacterium setense]|uniref:anthrone oxygenase family protein n=1 Tax=Mycolicibacterium setense TaxID=431269 RepID=UPI00057405EB|nr:anthrone oxygenase family protein [Mycolicibacterium setense]KHO21660.1 hypothetical protein QQ25_14015 [Mycolicibacterium setense]